jgi:alpha-L-rhamnosidase
MRHIADSVVIRCAPASLGRRRSILRPDAGAGRWHPLWRGATLLLAVLLCVCLAPGALARPDSAGVSAAPAAPHAIYAPFIQRADSFLSDTPIWAHAGKPAKHEVALFRATFTLDQPLAAPKLALFADTRYEVWIDGVWVGRGPARFTRRLREYDIHLLATLAAGRHVVAVLVQWAPNTRRSESTAPFLQGHLQGWARQGEIVVTRTGPGWAARLSPAWRADAAPVHTWGLIGPTELLDFRALPKWWMQPAFGDASWPRAVVMPQPARYQPRSIPLLANIPIAASVREVGLLSPGYALAERPPQPATIPFRAQARTTFTLETLATSVVSITQAIQIDGAPLAWGKRVGRPDVVFATRELTPGAHLLRFSGTQPLGLTYSASTNQIAGLAQPLQQGTNAGRRLLLAEPVSKASAVAVSAGDGLGLSFAGPPAYAILDLGRVVHGRVVAIISGPAGTVVDIGWDERLWQGKRPLPYPGSLHPEWNQTDSWVLDGQERAITTIDTRSGRYLMIAAWGAAKLTGLHVYEERYPTERLGSFSSPDALLNRIWQVGVDTLYPNMTDAYADPWRERGQWWGDGYVDDHANMAAFGDLQLLGRGITLMAEAVEQGRAKALAPNGDGNYSLDYAMHWVHSADDYRMRGGDAQILARVYPKIASFIAYLARYQRQDTGLLDIPYGAWSQTAYVDNIGSYNRYGQSTAINAQYYSTLLAAANLADNAGDPGSAKVWRRKATDVKNAITTYLYRSSEGQYITTIFDGRVYGPSTYAQAWAIAYDAVPVSERQRVADRLLALLSPDPSHPNMQIFGMFWTLEALGRTGRTDEAIALIKRYYGFMLDRGATTWWEHFNADKSYTASLSHGWGTSPTWFLTTYVLGARQTGPHSWSLRPAIGSLSQASGTLPLGDKALQVAWNSQRCGATEITIDAPAGTRGDVMIPFDGPTSLSLNGAVVWRDGRALAPDVAGGTNGARIALSGGIHRIVAQRGCYRSSDKDLDSLS